MVYKENGKYTYEFVFHGRRQRKRGYDTRGEAQDAEDALRKRLRAIVDGVELDDSESPDFNSWAGIYLDWAKSAKNKRRRLRENSTVEFDVRVVLRFFGKRPAQVEPKNKFEHRAFRDVRPHYGLTLADVVRDRTWITKFEDWMMQRGVSGSQRNKYRSALRNMYRLACSHEYRNITGCSVNPFAEVMQDPTERRYTTFDGAANLNAVRNAAAPHVRLAIDIALYAIKFRRGSILDLEWSKGRNSRAWIDADMNYLITTSHKTMHHTGLPQVAIISPQLKKLLLATKKKQDATNKRLSKRYGRTYSTCNHVVQWEGKPIADIKRAFRAACERAGVPYGMRGGVTFHSLRHETGTQAVTVRGLSDAMRQAIGGWKTNSASQIYKELVPEHEREAVLAMARITEQKLARGGRGESRGDLPRTRRQKGANTRNNGLMKTAASA